MPSVYILKTTAGKYYIGSTSNLKNRIKHHQGGCTPSTRRLGKPDLIFRQEYPTLNDARFVERKLKKLKRKDYIEKIIKEGEIRIKS
jgi:predicted GIY-YIG superfamily endonuclease